MTPLKTQAIQTALNGEWETAVKLNQQLLKEDPSDIETLNRLGYALAIIGKIKNARQTYKQVLRLDSQNPIAIKNLKRLSEKNGQLESVKTLPTLNGEIETMFIEEAGKTKVVELTNVAEPKIISGLMTAEYVQLKIKRSKIFALDPSGKFIGMLPEDLGRRLIKFINGGNNYEAYIKSIQPHRITIFIKETKQANRYKNQQSFITTAKTKVHLSGLKHQSPEDEE